MAEMTHSQLATKLIVEGCLGNASGKIDGKMPMQPVTLSPTERESIGLSPGGATLFYPLLPTGVFIDLAGVKATVWYTDADADQALGVFEAAMKRAYPKVKQLRDEASPADPFVRVRSYQVEFGQSRFALVKAGYPTPGARQKRFLAEVSRQDRKN
jgi:hypothetical protein